MEEGEEREEREQRAFRLDFFIAIAALLVSSISAFALIYQTHVIGQQYAATIWPYLDVESFSSSTQEHIDLDNDGLGPALIRSAQLTIDGKPEQSWNDYFRMLVRGLPPRIKHASIHGSLEDIGPSYTIRPGYSKRLFAIDYNVPALANIIQRHRIELSFCYCSLNGNCWLLRTTPGDELSTKHTPVSACTSTASILSGPTSPSARPRRK